MSSTAPSPVGGSSSGLDPSPRQVGAAASAAPNGLQLSATIQFGKPGVGSPFGPNPPHDQSAHAKDDMVPRTVVIDKGGTVTINTFAAHQVAIYDDGTEPEDIDMTDLVLMPNGCPRGMTGTIPLMIDDDTNRIELFDQPCGPGSRQVVHQFDAPGKYLVICAFLPHFQVQMYGWVVVRDR
jgi:plastocyanin